MGDLVKAGSKYSDEQRRQAALEYSLTGSMAKVAERTGIPATTLSDWKRSYWWDEVTVQVRSEKEAQILADNERIMDLAQKEIEDRLKYGDIQLVRTKHGIEERRLPVRARDAAVIKGIAEDKRRVQLNMPTTITANHGTREHLERLAEHFAEISNAYELKNVKPVEGQCEEVE